MSKRERKPGRFIPDKYRGKHEHGVVKIDLNKPMKEILAELEVPVERALMIGDTEYDAAMAAAIGMPALGVASGVHDAARIRAAGALAVIGSVQELPSWLASR